MKIINSILGIIIVIVGSLFISITVDNEILETISYKILGVIILTAGVYYLKRIAKFGKQ